MILDRDQEEKLKKGKKILTKRFQNKKKPLRKKSERNRMKPDHFLYTKDRDQ